MNTSKTHRRHSRRKLGHAARSRQIARDETLGQLLHEAHRLGGYVYRAPGQPWQLKVGKA